MATGPHWTRRSGFFSLADDPAANATTRRLDAPKHGVGIVRLRCSTPTAAAAQHPPLRSASGRVVHRRGRRAARGTRLLALVRGTAEGAQSRRASPPRGTEDVDVSVASSASALCGTCEGCEHLAGGHVDDLRLVVASQSRRCLEDVVSCSFSWRASARCKPSGGIPARASSLVEISRRSNPLQRLLGSSPTVVIAPAVILFSSRRRGSIVAREGRPSGFCWSNGGCPLSCEPTERPAYASLAMNRRPGPVATGVGAERLGR